MLCSSTHLTQLFQVNHKPLHSSVPTPQTKEKKHQSPPPPTAKPLFHPLFMFLQSQLSLFKRSSSSVRLQGREEVEQGGDTGWAKVTQGHNWFYSSSLLEIITIFLPSDQIAVTGWCSRKTKSALKVQPVGKNVLICVPDWVRFIQCYCSASSETRGVQTRDTVCS